MAHSITDIDYYRETGNLSYRADGAYIEVQGEFRRDKDGNFHHSHIFADGKEIEFTFK